MSSCIDCGHKVSKSQYTRCKRCSDKYYSGEKSPLFTGGLPKCLGCGKELSRYNGVKRCAKCAFLGKLNHSYKDGRMKTGAGYITILLRSHPYANNHGRVMEHRLVMETHIGRYLKPDELIDHINGVIDDNRIENLRLANRSQNAANQKLSKQNTSGYKGVIKSKKDRKWIAQIKYQQRLFHIGTYDTKEEAAKAYDNKANELFGEFANLNFPDK